MTIPAVALTPRPDDDDGLGMGASAGALLDLATRADFHRWETQLATTGNCANPIRLQGRIDAIDHASGEARTMYDTDYEPGSVLLVACGNRREHVCPACSQVYKNDARQIIRSGLTGGKGTPETVATHPCVFATFTAPGFGPVHTTRTGPRGRQLPCRPRRDASQRRCPHGRDISCRRTHHPDDPRLGQPICPDCYDYIGHVLFNAYAPELWRRFTIYLPRQLARMTGITQKALRQQVRVRFVKVAEYQARGLVHYHAIIRVDAASEDCQPPPGRYTAALLTQAIRQAAAAVSCDTGSLLADAIRRALGDTGVIVATDPSLGRILRFGTQIDTRVIRSDAGGLPGTGSALSAQAVANYIAKYATKTISAPGLPDHPVRSTAAIAALHCVQHYKRLISTCWELGKHPDAASLGLNRWTHMLGYRGHFLTKSRRYSVTFGQLRQARVTHRRAQRHPDGEKDRGAATSTNTPFWSWPAGTTPEPATPPPPNANSRSPPPHAPASTTRSHERRPGRTKPQGVTGMDQLLYRPGEAAKVLGRSKSSLYQLIRSNRIRSIKDGKFRFITAEALQDYVRTLEREYEEVS